jgi:hypothetical protein
MPRPVDKVVEVVEFVAGVPALDANPPTEVVQVGDVVGVPDVVGVGAVVVRRATAWMM